MEMLNDKKKPPRQKVCYEGSGRQWRGVECNPVCLITDEGIGAPPPFSRHKGPSKAMSDGLDESSVTGNER